MWRYWVRRLYHKHGVAGSIYDRVLGIFECLILLFALSSPGIHSPCDRNEYQGISLGVKMSGHKTENISTFMCR
jgi:hypothetical protein